MSVDTSLVVSTYTLAADHFDGLPFWHHFGQRTVDLLAPAPGSAVVDLFCGTGASALPAARAVGPAGSVLGVDITPALIEVARATAAREGLCQARFQAADVTTFDLPPASVDAVQSVFGLFFADDVPAVLARAWSWLRPGGRLVSTVWGEVVLSPGEAWFWEAVLAEDPTLDHISPASKLATPEALIAAHVAAALSAPSIVRERWSMPLASPAAFWPVILGTSNRGVLEALPTDARARVHAHVMDRLAREHVTALDMEALVAIAVR
ncbi:MAG: class I SAM-dependent methyltransferase [Vicinamibacterales bacterium]